MFKLSNFERTWKPMQKNNWNYTVILLLSTFSNVLCVFLKSHYTAIASGGLLRKCFETNSKNTQNKNSLNHHRAEVKQK